MTYGAVDKAFYLENGSERDCRFHGNVAITTLFNPAIAKPGPIHAAAFYLTTQETELVANVAAGSEGTGYWLEGTYEPFIPHGVEIGGTPPPAAQLTEAVPTSPNATRFVFNENKAHSCGYHGFFADLVRPYLFTETQSYQAYKCGVYGLFTRNFGYHKWNSVRISDCQVAIYAATTGFILVDGQGTTHFDDVLVVGDSVNVGSDWSSAETFVGRSLPEHGVRPNGTGGGDLGLFGLEIYDGVIFVEDAEFANFQDVTLQSGANRVAAAITNRIENVAWAVDPRNTIRTTSFLAPCRPVFFRQGPPKANGVNQATIYDLDGSISSQSPSLQNAAPAWIVGGLHGTMLPDGTYAATNPPTTSSDPAWISAWNAWVVPDNTSSGSGAGGIAQLLIRDDLAQLAGAHGYINVQRNGSPAKYRSYHTGGTGILSNLFPANLETNHVYDLSQPLDQTTGLPVHSVSGTTVTYSLRFSRAGEWVTLRIPMTTGFDPFNSARADDITFKFGWRLDMLLFPPVTWPAPGVALTKYNLGADILPVDIVGVTAFPTNGAVVFVPELTYPLAAPGTSSTFPFEVAWARDAATNTLEIRMVLLDYLNTAAFGPRPWFLPGGSLSFLPAGGYGTTLDSLFEGGMINVTVTQQ
ncbi:MAG: hypothetical protein R3F20_02870 [Planctomycetota bacterium]